MTISIFELFSIGIGPSSSHTVGPMRAARDFLVTLEDRLLQVAKVEVQLFGSLAYTGEGHGTIKATVMGLEGEKPDTIDPDTIAQRMQQISTEQQIHLLATHAIPFALHSAIKKDFTTKIDFHSNAMQLTAYDQQNQLLHQEMYYSIGGGFITKQSEIDESAQLIEPTQDVQYHFETFDELLTICQQQQLSIPQVMIANEKAWRSEEQIKKDLLTIIETMTQSVSKGCQTEGVLDGGLEVHRRAPSLYKKLLEQGQPNQDHPQSLFWLNVFAMAVNEENAAGGRVVTAPTNGAAGIIPAVLEYYKCFCPQASEHGAIDLLLTAAAIGILYKKNASISGAEMGCQGEVGVACSMAAGGLACALGGSIYQIENAAEIGMEHNLGLTCDPVKGLVQIPCIERNAMGAVKAVNAAQLALAEEGRHKVSLDMVINTMYEIGSNMNSIYKETSLGGLAVNVPEC